MKSSFSNSSHHYCLGWLSKLLGPHDLKTWTDMAIANSKKPFLFPSSKLIYPIRSKSFLAISVQVLRVMKFDNNLCNQTKVIGHKSQKDIMKMWRTSSTTFRLENFFLYLSVCVVSPADFIDHKFVDYRDKEFTETSLPSLEIRVYSRMAPNAIKFFIVKWVVVKFKKFFIRRDDP